jgi:glycosyltransferase involved in cell wall biosynthesis
VVNDGSLDNFKEEMGKVSLLPWAAELPIGIVEQPNKGANAARNAGFRLAKGEYVIFWDADTIAVPEMLSKMQEALENNKDASYVYSRFKFGWKIMRSQEFDGDDLKENNFIDTTSLIKRSALESGSPFDETLKKFQDWDLWLSLLEKGKTGVFISEVLYKKEVKGRKGYSSWLPSIVYKLPFKNKTVRDYELAKAIIQRKHGLAPQSK